MLALGKVADPADWDVGEQRWTFGLELEVVSFSDPVGVGQYSIVLNQGSRQTIDERWADLLEQALWAGYDGRGDT